jgi:hypothetical protein
MEGLTESPKDGRLRAESGPRFRSSKKFGFEEIAAHIFTRRRKMARPTGVTILAVLGFICGAITLLGALGMFVMGTVGMAAMSRGGGSMAAFLGALGAFAGVALLVFAALYVICGIGLLKLANWGRVLTIILVAIGLVFSLFGAFHAMMGSHIGLVIWDLIFVAIDAWILMYLFKPHVKQAFGAA